MGRETARSGASELIAVVQTAMLSPNPCTVLRNAILTHPTMAEGLTVLLPASRRSDQVETTTETIAFSWCRQRKWS
jgi:hypothetical protein